MMTLTTLNDQSRDATTTSKSWLAEAVFILSALVLLGYLLPWLTHPTAALTVGAYDLAEWTTLHPASRSESPPLIASFMLRVQLTLLTLIIAMQVPRVMLSDARRWLHLALLAGLIVAQLPPPEFLANLGDANYQQQFVLAALSAVGAVAVYRFALQHTTWRSRLTISLSVAGLITMSIGLFATHQLIVMFNLTPHLGIGPIITGLAYAGLIISSAYHRQ